MKRFFPSSVMLTPFVVKNYSEQEREESTTSQQEPQLNSERGRDEQKIMPIATNQISLPS
ncbi:hypothetical protein TW81_11380 [Vibrio galatheae]|uniref:Uncharacterized protein n=1 Tax=Vibrio galatheae TaxID=579748 RepID=A0A0F4NI49_9VIBR|nr:hypothetical protein [Vibrio galatheae]KJY82810.1 hypothetical protein TW81_11380 [Vibrio galatheae]